MGLIQSIQNIPGFPRKFPIANDVPRINWSDPLNVELIGEIAAQQATEISAAQIITAVTNIQHNSLLGITSNDHHIQYHGNTHTAEGSDPLELPFEFKKDGTVYAKIDASGNLFIKGRYLKI